jgi:hypothetical protein
MGKISEYDMFENFGLGIYGFCDFLLSMAMYIGPLTGYHVDVFFIALRKQRNTFSPGYFD